MIMIMITIMIIRTMMITIVMTAIMIITIMILHKQFGQYHNHMILRHKQRLETCGNRRMVMDGDTGTAE